MGGQNVDSVKTGLFGLPQSRTWAGRIADKIEIALLVFAGGAFVVIGVLIVNQVFFRYILAAPPMWTEELTRYVFVWLSWLSAAVVFRRGQHVTVDAISEIIPKRMILIHDIFIRLICVFIVLYFFIFGLAALEYTNLLSAALEINMMFVYASAPVACLVMLAFSALDAVESCLCWRRGNSC